MNNKVWICPFCGEKFHNYNSSMNHCPKCGKSFLNQKPIYDQVSTFSSEVGSIEIKIFYWILILIFALFLTGFFQSMVGFILGLIIGIFIRLLVHWKLNISSAPEFLKQYRCPKCGKKFRKKQPKCPNCGQDLRYN